MCGSPEPSILLVYYRWVGQVILTLEMQLHALSGRIVKVYEIIPKLLYMVAPISCTHIPHSHYIHNLTAELAPKYPISLHLKINIFLPCYGQMLMLAPQECVRSNPEHVHFISHVQDNMKRYRLHCCKDEALWIVLIRGTSGTAIRVRQGSNFTVLFTPSLKCHAIWHVCDGAVKRRLGSTVISWQRQFKTWNKCLIGYGTIQDGFWMKY